MNATDDLHAIIDTIGRADLILFADFDGTLTPIVEDPNQVRLPVRAQRLLRAIAEHAPVAVISGRDLEDVVARVGLPELAYVGSHGFEVIGPRREFTRLFGGDFLPLLDRAESALREQIRVEGGRIERKRVALAVHYRQVAPERREEVRTKTLEVVKNITGLVARQGKAVIDIVPDMVWNKGEAVKWLIEALDARERKVIYLGDDTTDEDAFRALMPDGVTVKVGEGETLARFRLRSVDRVHELLEVIVSSRGGRP